MRGIVYLIINGWEGRYFPTIEIQTPEAFVTEPSESFTNFTFWLGAEADDE